MHHLSCFQLRFSFQGLFGFYSLHPLNFCDNPRMRVGRAITHRAVPGSSLPTSTLFLGALAVAALLACSPLSAQTQSPQPEQEPTPRDGPAYTLHLSTRVVQIPTLVIGSFMLPDFKPDQFNIKLNSGPSFHPSRVRREGDDPITLAILLDVSGDQSHLLPALSKNFSNWIATSFKLQDRISIFALDCGLIRTDSDEPPDPVLLQQGFDAAINSTAIHGDKLHATCEKSLHLWGAMNYVMEQLSQLPGRRVLFVVSNGHDGGSKIKRDEVRIAATRNAVTVFGFSSPDSLNSTSAENWESVCKSTGGLLFGGIGDQLPNELTNFISADLRNRYILEFTMNDDPTPGKYIVYVTTIPREEIVEPAGLSVPLPDPNRGPKELPSAAPTSHP
jgi:hypothetical protein